MKKQFVLVMLLLTILGSGNIFAQALPGSLPQTINCTNNAFNPIAGVPYDYSATLNPAGGAAYWYATTSTTFMTAGVRTATEEAIGGTYVLAAINYQNNAAGATSPTTTTITWTSAGVAAATVAPADPPELFVVVEYTAPATGCANNMKVYPIRPVNAFVVDILNLDATTYAPAGYGVTEEQCFPGVQSAVWIANPAPDGSIDYDFGINYLYFEVVAANFSGSYTPSFQLSGMDVEQTADIDWGYTLGTYTNNVTTNSPNGTYPGTAVSTTVPSTANGVSIYVRVTVHNNDFEGLAQMPITLAVDAVNSAGADDVNNATCLLNTPYQDLAVQNLNQRPTVNAVAPGVFLPVAP